MIHNTIKFKEFLNDEIEEIYKFKWYLGEILHKDPLELYTLEEISTMWITQYAAEFRENWIKIHGEI